jgi:hypothetical protein
LSNGIFSVELPEGHMYETRPGSIPDFLNSKFFSVLKPSRLAAACNSLAAGSNEEVAMEAMEVT